MTRTCTNCGEPIAGTPEEHHVDQQRGNNDPDNLTTRCRRCHHDGTHDNPRRTDRLATERYGPRSPSTGPPGP
jgi:5-methylcytosine-specific restriction endonuclease McrA